MVYTSALSMQWHITIAGTGDGVIHFNADPTEIQLKITRRYTISFAVDVLWLLNCSMGTCRHLRPFRMFC